MRPRPLNNGRMDNKSHYLTFAPDIATDPAGGTPTGFSGIAYSGGVVPNYGWFGDTIIDMASVQIPERMFALVNHEEEDRAGHCRVWIENGAIRVAGQFSRATQAGQSVAAEFGEGAPWKLSIGFNANSERLDPPRAVDVNGQTVTVGAIFRNARILEVSFVYADADPNTQVSAFSAAPNIQQAHPMSDDLAKQVADLTGQIAGLTQQLAAANARADAAESTLSAQQKAARLAAVKTLFEALGREWDDAKAEPYLDMSDAAFASVAADLKSARPSHDPTLFSATATRGKDASGGAAVVLNAADVYAQRRPGNVRAA